MTDNSAGSSAHKHQAGLWLLLSTLAGRSILALLAVVAAAQSGPPPPGSASLSVTGGPLTFSFQIGSSVPAAQRLFVSVTSGTATFTASSSAASWLQVSPSGGTLSTISQTLTVTVSPGGLAANTYVGTIIITADGVDRQSADSWCDSHGERRRRVQQQSNAKHHGDDIQRDR